MNLIIAAVVLAGLAALAEYTLDGGIKDPWKKIIVVGIVILLVFGILMAVGVFPFRW